MELIVADFGDPVAAVVILKRQHGLVSLPQVPDAHSAVCTTRCKRMQSALVVGNVQYLIDMSSEAEVA